MNRTVLRSERYVPIILGSIGLSLLGIMIFCDIPKMFTRGYIRIDHWDIGEIIGPLMVIFGFMLIATKYISMQNRSLKDELNRLRPKYYSILRGAFRKNLPSVNQTRLELASKIQRCIRWETKLRLYEDLYDLCLLQGVLQFEQDRRILQELIEWLTEHNYPDRRRLSIFKERAIGLSRDGVDFFRFLQMSLVRNDRFLEPMGKILSQVTRHEFYHVDNIPSYLKELRGEDAGREGMLGVFVSIMIFSLFTGVGILEKILPWSLVGTRNHFK